MFLLFSPRVFPSRTLPLLPPSSPAISLGRFSYYLPRPCPSSPVNLNRRLFFPRIMSARMFALSSLLLVTPRPAWRFQKSPVNAPVFSAETRKVRIHQRSSALRAARLQRLVNNYEFRVCRRRLITTARVYITKLVTKHSARLSLVQSRGECHCRGATMPGYSTALPSSRNAFRMGI